MSRVTLDKQEALESLADKLESDLAIAKARAREEGVYADREWFAETHRKVKTLRRQASNMARQLKLRHEFYERFYRLSMLRLPNDDFQLLNKEAKSNI